MSSLNEDYQNSGSNQNLWTVTLTKTNITEKSEISKEEKHDVNYEEALSLTGTGKFHTLLALVSGLTFLAAGLETNLNAYILPSAQCDLSLTSEQMGLLNAVFLAGALTSSFLWGALADMIGRRKVLVSGMLIDGLLTLFSSLSQRFYVLLIFRYFNGFIVGGPSALILAYMGEFFPERLRAKMICYVGVSWTLSWAIMPAIAWIVIPMQWSYSINSFIFNSWRFLIAIVALPSLLSALLLSLLPESPRFLLTQGRQQEARDTLASIYAYNTGTSTDQYVVKSLWCEERKSDSCCQNESSSSVWQAISDLAQQGQGLFLMPTLKTTTLTCTLFFTNMFGCMRCYVSAFLMFASGFCVLVIYFLQNSTQNLIVSALFQFFIGTAHLVINSLIVDMFPPSISGMGVCLTIFSGRLGAMVSNLVFGHLLDISCAVPILLVAAVSFGGGFLSLLIPKYPYSEDQDKIDQLRKSVEDR
ncbi:synaptic vesicle glycoprotein 2B [Nilaparvata lugens]|uniref:synaptic vesicle glycoprotein 2B n=1 Tax=Nilaparvata lugens TaxID=108931 RepID=UPI00193D3873|nr:synaptic vesicle glycoprotein 2B [Nilaparvata lugens]